MQRILGQPRAIDAITSALHSGRFHHAWIFSGPRGVGKYTTAIELARLLLAPPHADCASAMSRLIDAGTHPDLHVIRKEMAAFSDEKLIRERKQMNIPIDLLRELIIGGRSGERYIDAPAYRTAAMGHGKVFIIDEAELIDPTGQNALLKTLEEPPAQTFLFLITTRPDRLLPTVRSRCHHVRFGPLDEASMRQWLAQAAHDHPELGSRDSNMAAWLVEFAEGSPGLALLALEHGFHDWAERLKPMLDELASGHFPVGMGDTLAELVDAFAVAWVKAHDNASKDAANKDGCRHMLSLLSAYVRRRLAAAVQQGGDAQPWLAAIDRLSSAERYLEGNVNLKLLMEDLVVQWAGGAGVEPVGA